MKERACKWPLFPVSARLEQRARPARVAPRRRRRAPALPPPAVSRARKLRFLEALRIADRAEAAAFAAGVPLDALAAERARDPVFAQAWDGICDPRFVELEKALIARAISGVAEPVFYQGRPCGVRIRYSDTLGMHLLRARMPDVYGRPAADRRGPGRDRETAGPSPPTASLESYEAEERELEALLQQVADRIRAAGDADGTPEDGNR